MFSLIFPGQGSQTVGMCKDMYLKFDLIKKIFKEADDILNFPITDLIFNGPKEKLDLTENTQPSIFLVGYSIFSLLKKEYSIDFDKINYFAGHSLGEYTALAAAEYINFSDAIKILKVRGKAMQSSVKKGKGGMIAILGSKIEDIEKLLLDNTDNYKCYIANDNSIGQIVVSGMKEDLDKFSIDLKKKSIKNISLAVSAPFHCELMSEATDIMKNEINNLKFNNSNKLIVSNVTANETNNPQEIKELLIKQIESRVRWRESIKFMASKETKNFIEVGPGKVLSGLIKRIDRNLKVSAIKSEEDISILKKNDEF